MGCKLGTEEFLYKRKGECGGLVVAIMKPSSFHFEWQCWLLGWPHAANFSPCTADRQASWSKYSCLFINAAIKMYFHAPNIFYSNSKPIIIWGNIPWPPRVRKTQITRRLFVLILKRKTYNGNDVYYID